jgi:hypothetical protein
MWNVLQVAIIVWLCIAYKGYLAPDASMGHIFLFSVLVAWLVTWLIARAIDLVRTNSRTCFLISLLITGAVIIWLTANGRSLDATGFALVGAIGFCIFVPSMWAVSKAILLVRRLQGYPPPPRPIRPPVTLAALVERWRVPLSYCMWWLLTVLFISLTFHGLNLWDEEIGRFPGEGWIVVISFLIVLIGPALATRAIIQWLLRSGSGTSESSAAQSDPVAPAALVTPAQMQPR